VDANTGEAARLMRAHAVRRLPVIENGQVAGVVTVSDLAPDDLGLPDGLALALARLSRPTANV
jgi:CBS-domain-containing membrane protein